MIIVKWNDLKSMQEFTNTKDTLDKVQVIAMQIIKDKLKSIAKKAYPSALKEVKTSKYKLPKCTGYYLIDNMEIKKDGKVTISNIFYRNKWREDYVDISFLCEKYLEIKIEYPKEEIKTLMLDKKYNAVLKSDTKSFDTLEDIKAAYPGKYYMEAKATEPEYKAIAIGDTYEDCLRCIFIQNNSWSYTRSNMSCANKRDIENYNDFFYGKNGIKNYMECGGNMD